MERKYKSLRMEILLYNELRPHIAVFFYTRKIIDITNTKEYKNIILMFFAILLTFIVFFSIIS